METREREEVGKRAGVGAYAIGNGVQTRLQ